ncbi:hypothetical protein [Velocimicrobium porci]|nr:hypothetical protein [Velocimicrobium porci]
MKNFRNDFVKITAVLLLISIIGITAFNHINVAHCDIQVCSILKESLESY